MLEVRRDLDLPKVLDTEKSVVSDLAELIIELVDGSIPGVGIDHEPSKDDSHYEVHYAHRRLVAAAIAGIMPKLVVLEGFLSGTRFDAGPGSNLHADLLDTESKVFALALCLRLHTAEEVNGANATLVNSAPGLTNRIGDKYLYSQYGSLSTEGYTLGYEIEKRHFSEEMVRSIKQGGYNPLVTEANIYHYSQLPLCSFLFRSYADIGPVTIHGLEAIDPEVRRQAYISDMKIAAQ